MPACRPRRAGELAVEIDVRGARDMGRPVALRAGAGRGSELPAHIEQRRRGGGAEAAGELGDLDQGARIDRGQSSRYLWPAA